LPILPPVFLPTCFQQSVIGPLAPTWSPRVLFKFLFPLPSSPYPFVSSIFGPSKSIRVVLSHSTARAIALGLVLPRLSFDLLCCTDTLGTHSFCSPLPRPSADIAFFLVEWIRHACPPLLAFGCSLSAIFNFPLSFSVGCADRFSIGLYACFFEFPVLFI